MKSVNIHEAKTNLSRLVDQAAKGEPFVIAKAGKPRVKVVTLDAPLSGENAQVGIPVRQDRDTGRLRPDGRVEIGRLFGTGE